MKIQGNHFKSKNNYLVFFLNPETPTEMRKQSISIALHKNRKIGVPREKMQARGPWGYIAK